MKAVAADRDSGTPMEEQNNVADPLRQRVLQLKEEGLETIRAWQMAWLEHRIAQWPSGWGENLQILIYGDFQKPQKELNFPSLGITVHPEPVQNSVIRSATCVLKATVIIQEKTVSAIIDAARRINILLGAWTLVTWGNSPIRWWSWVTHDTGGGVRDPIDHHDLLPAINGVLRLPDNVRQRVDSALYWIREPRNFLLEHHRNDLLRIYSAYWNAFECLVDAISILRPQNKLSSEEKQQRIDEFFAGLSKKPTVQDIQNCYRGIVDPGLVGKAEHALKVCFGGEAERYIEECFRCRPRRERLYDIRNAINHGEVDAENPEELIRIESRFTRLWIIVWGMFGRLIPFPAPVDRP